MIILLWLLLNVTSQQLTDIHAYVAQQLDGERLWPSSMPCQIDDPDEISLASYGSSNTGQMKNLYRQGLKYRYGSQMQVIAGIHFNLSFPDSFLALLAEYQAYTGSEQLFKSDQYLALIRNFKRNVWLLSFLFGASPAVSQTFVDQQNSSYSFSSLANGDLYLPYATSLRLSDLGYTNNAQAELSISYDSLPEYIQDLKRAMQTPVEAYQPSINQQAPTQLNSNLLQIENEYYSTIRPKCVTRGEETPLKALRARGIEYVEVRSMDVNPFSAVGIDKSQVYFLDVFLCYCLLASSPAISNHEQRLLDENLNRVVTQGRDPQLKLWNKDGEQSLFEVGERLFVQLEQVAAYMDQASNGECYQAVIQKHRQWLSQPEKTLSGQLMQQYQQQELGCTEWAQKQAEQHYSFLSQHQMTVFDQQHMSTVMVQSVEAQRMLEQQPQLEFTEFLGQYFSRVMMDSD